MDRFAILPGLVELVEPFARRVADLPIDKTTPDQLKDDVMSEKNEDGLSFYTANPDYLREGVRGMDALLALYSIHPDIGPKKSLRRIAQIFRTHLIIKDKAGAFAEVQQEIDLRQKELGIDDLDKLIEKYKTVQAIQRLGAQVVVKEALEKL